MGSPDDWVVTLAAVRACLLACVALLHAVVAMGSSIGLHLWSADRTELRCLLRVASVATVLGLSLGALVVWGRAGRSTAAGWDDRVVASLTWTLSAALFVAALLAHSSRSRVERRLVGPLAVLAGLLVSWPGEPAASAAGAIRRLQSRPHASPDTPRGCGHRHGGGQGRGTARRD